jgi:3D (Asp-Asp-Asp) domain-containing protein
MGWRRAPAALVAALVVVAPAQAARRDGVPRPEAVPAACNPQKPVHEHLIRKRTWVRHVAITEYFSSPERWFKGRKVSAPGLPGKHRVDWLYSAHGVSMQGDGIGLDGRHYHIDALGSGGWVNVAGHHTVPGRCAGHWSRGHPYWLEGGWRNRDGRVTWPLATGGWVHGLGKTLLSYQGVTFAPGSAIPLTPYRTLAVDPKLIPKGSRVYIPYYKGISGGWFVAQDVGGAIIGRHLDVYRSPPRDSSDHGRYLQNQRVLVVPPGS